MYILYVKPSYLFAKKKYLPDKNSCLLIHSVLLLKRFHIYYHFFYIHYLTIIQTLHFSTWHDFIVITIYIYISHVFFIHFSFLHFYEFLKEWTLWWKFYVSDLLVCLRAFYYHQIIFLCILKLCRRFIFLFFTGVNKYQDFSCIQFCD